MEKSTDDWEKSDHVFFLLRSGEVRRGSYWAGEEIEGRRGVR